MDIEVLKTAWAKRKELRLQAAQLEKDSEELEERGNRLIAKGVKTEQSAKPHFEAASQAYHRGDASIADGARLEAKKKYAEALISECTARELLADGEQERFEGRQVLAEAKEIRHKARRLKAEGDVWFLDAVIEQCGNRAYIYIDDDTCDLGYGIRFN